MNVTVLLSSGDVDTWTNVDKAEINMDLMGALVVSVDGKLAAMYAGGMWMRVEYDVED